VAEQEAKLLEVQELLVQQTLAVAVVVLLTMVQVLVEKTAVQVSS
jgi:hypothetical protein